MGSNGALDCKGFIRRAVGRLDRSIGGPRFFVYSSSRRQLDRGVSRVALLMVFRVRNDDVATHSNFTICVPWIEFGEAQTT